MNRIPGSPLPVYIGPGVGKRSHSMSVRCPHCGSDPGVHCYVYAEINRWRARGHYTQEFHQERIDLSKQCQCGQPGTVTCDEPLNDQNDPCWAWVCYDCAKPSKQGGHRCRYHQQNGDCDE